MTTILQNEQEKSLALQSKKLKTLNIGAIASFRPSDPALARARNQKRDQNEALGRLKEQREKKERAKEANKSSSGPLNVGDYFSSDSEGEDEDDSRNNLASSDSDSGKDILVVLKV